LKQFRVVSEKPHELVLRLVGLQVGELTEGDEARRRDISEHQDRDYDEADCGDASRSGNGRGWPEASELNDRFATSTPPSVQKAAIKNLAAVRTSTPVEEP
jgi:hypothetical protein